MPYVGGKIADLFDLGPAERALVGMVDKGVERLHHWIVFNTPIGNAAAEARGLMFHGTDVPGALRESWRVGPLSRHREVAEAGGAVGFVSGFRREVTTDREYAADVEWGTGLWGPSHAKYLIEPKKPGGWLHWIDRATGEDVFAKRVMHPGSPGAHMVAIAVEVTEAEVREGLFEPELERWVRETEGLVR